MHCDGCHSRPAKTKTLSASPRNLTFYFCSVECAEHNWQYISGNATPRTPWKSRRRNSRKLKAMKSSPRTKERILYLLSQYANMEKIRQGLVELAQYYHMSEIPEIEFVPCQDFIPGRTDGETIYMCNQTRTAEFQRTRAPHIDYNAELIPHFAIVVLHEFAHILQPGWNEGRIDEWIQEFIAQ